MRGNFGLWLVFVYNVCTGYDGEHDDVIVRRGAQLEVKGVRGSHAKANCWRLRRSSRASSVAVQRIHANPFTPSSKYHFTYLARASPRSQHRLIPKDFFRTIV